MPEAHLNGLEERTQADMSDQPTGHLLLNPKDERIRCRAGVQVELTDQILDRRAGMPLVSVNLTRQPLTRTESWLISSMR